MTITTEQMINRRIDDRIDSATADCNTWLDRFAADPDNAFEWSQKTFTAAAQKKIWTGVRELIETVDGTFRDKLVATRDAIQAEALRKARFPSHSSSQQSNLMDIERCAACAKAAEELDQFIQIVDRAAAKEADA